MDPVFQLVLRACFALLLGAAAWHKLSDTARFRSVLSAYGLVPGLALAPVAVLVPAVEASLAFALAAGLAPGPVGACVALLMLGYAGAIHVSLHRGRDIADCGCTGPAARVPASPLLVVRNLVLAASGCLLALPVLPRETGTLDFGIAAAAVATLSSCWLASERLLALAPRAAALRRRLR